MPNCDWGRPCDCSECSGGRRQQALQSTCSSFGCNQPPTETVDTLGVDRKGISSYGTRAYCSSCYKTLREKEAAEEARRRTAEEEENKRRRELHAVFTERAGKLAPSLAPIKELRFNRVVREGYGHFTIHHLPSCDLLIQKVRGRWMFCKNRERLFYELKLDGLYDIADPRRR